MPHRVGDRLDDDPVRRHLHRGGQRFQVLVRVDGPGQLGSSTRPGGQVVLVGPLAERGDESELVECRGSQAVDQPTYLGDLVARLVGQLRRPGRLPWPGSRRIRSRAASSRIARVANDGPSPSWRSRRTRRRSSSRAVISCCRDIWRLAVDRDCLDQCSDLSPDVLEQASVSGSERVAAGVDLEAQPAEDGVPHRQVDGGRASARLPDRGLDPPRRRRRRRSRSSAYESRNRRPRSSKRLVAAPRSARSAGRAAAARTRRGWGTPDRRRRADG